MSELTTEVALSSGKAKSPKPRAGWLTALVPGLLVALICGLFVPAFLWPLSQMEPKNISLAAAGPAAPLSQIEETLKAQQDDLFEFTQVDDRDAAVRAIEEREVLGGIVVGPEGVEILTASAANAQVAQLLTQVASGVEKAQAQAPVPAQSSAPSVIVTDVVSGNGNAFAGNLTMLPALIGGMMGGMLSMVMVKRPAYRLITIVTGAVGAGLIGAAVLGPWFDMVPGGFGAHTLALGMGALAISAVISGLGSLFGRGGAGLGVALVLLIGTPWGGVMVPTEFLPEFMGALGSHMPTGAVVNLMKSISYFPAAETSGQWWTLVAWVAAGVAVILLGAFIHRRKQPVIAG